MHFLALVLAILLAAVPAAPAGDGQLYVLAINGGGDRADNFASHLAHLRQLIGLLAATGVPRDRITVLASDGGDPAPDLATRDPEPEHAWLLQGTQVEPWLRDLTTYETSALAGIDLRPATVPSLARAVRELRGRLRSGDTLLVYVTDHGTQSHRDPTQNRITLWGPRESISVARLGSLLARLPSGVRVVSLMSQCFSGGFAYLHESRERSRIPRGNTCGYFSSTPDRPAYGCYPEVRSQEAVGHSFKFLSALARRGRFPAAHAEVLTTDDTPDCPLRSSDIYLAELLGRHAPRAIGEPAFADRILHAALAGSEYVRDRQLAERVAARYGISQPSSLVTLEDELGRLFAFLDTLDSEARVWETALADSNRANLDAFLASRAHWRPRLEDRALRLLPPAERRARALELLGELFAFLATDGERLAQSNRLVKGLGSSDEIAYRTEIRIAALLRIRFLLTSIAGREWLKQHPKENEAYLALARCEDLALPAPERVTAPPETPAQPHLPPLDEDQRRASNLRPGWIGITFTPAGPGARKRWDLAAGAVKVTGVLPRSPAAKAGLRRGDLVVGRPTRAFTHVGQVRPLIAAVSPGAPLTLEVLRAGKRTVVSVVAGASPIETR
jgi:hypothetical protein